MNSSILELKKYVSNKKIENTFETFNKRKIPEDQYFLKGPIPMSWLYKTMPLGGKCLPIAIEILFWSGVKKSNEIKFSCGQLSKYRISRFSSMRAINKLEKAGLIFTIRKPGRRIIVKINFPETWLKNRPTLRNVNPLEN